MVGRIDGRVLIGTGLFIRAISLFMLAHLNLEVGIWNIVWANIINGFANGFLFVPLTTLSMGTLPDEQMGRGTGLYNLTRNMGASFGVSMVATMLVRDGQRHQDVLATHTTPYNPAFRSLFDHLRQYLTVHHCGFGERAYRTIHGILHQQAMLLSYTDDFRVLGVLTLCCLPFMLLFRKEISRKSKATVH